MSDWLKTELNIQSTQLKMYMYDVFHYTGYVKLLNHIKNATHKKYSTFYSRTPLNGHPSTADIHDAIDNSKNPDCPSIHFNT